MWARIESCNLEIRRFLWNIMNDEFKFGKEVFEVKRTYQPKKASKKKKSMVSESV